MIKTTIFQKKMVLKAKEKRGVYENFGQAEIKKLKDKYGYIPYGSQAERKIVEAIDFLDNWCMRFDDNKLKKFIEIGV